MTLALARKYRPRNFATVAVQSHVANTLKGAIAHGRVAHGYLLCGPRGTGKTTLARVLAMALNCERRKDTALQGEPCGECQNCQRIWSGTASLDVVEIDAASNRGVDDARDLRERAMYAPSSDDGYKVYIIDEAHMLTREAWNALLKVLEEPPPRVVFVFATTEPQKIAQAAAPVLSRLQRFDLRRIGPADIRERLAGVLTEEHVAFEQDALAMIARAADGGLRDALSLADQVLSLGERPEVTTELVRATLGLVPDEEYLGLLDMIAERRAADIFGAVQRMADAGVDFTLVLSGLGDLLRGQLALALGGVPPELPERMRVALEERKGRLSANDLLRMLRAMLELEPMYRRSGQQQLLLETLLVRFALLDRTIELEAVLRGLAGGGGGSPQRTKHDTLGAPTHAVPMQADEATAPARAAPPAARVRGDAGKVANSNADAREGVGDDPEQPTLPTVSQVSSRWSDVVDAVRTQRRAILAEAVQRLTPVSVTSDGALALEYDPVDETLAQGANSARADVLSAVRGVFSGIRSITLRAAAPGAPESQSSKTSVRMTARDVRRQRTEQITVRNPLLDAAVKALDLEMQD